LFRADSRSEVRGRRERERGLGEETGPSSSVKGLREREVKRERETETGRTSCLRSCIVVYKGNNFNGVITCARFHKGARRESTALQIGHETR
jgi:hypothetical protein